MISLHTVHTLHMLHIVQCFTLRNKNCMLDTSYIRMMCPNFCQFACFIASLYHRSSLGWKTERCSNGRGRPTVIDTCQSLRAARSDCSWCNYEGRWKKRGLEEWVKEREREIGRKSCHASWLRRGVKQITPLNLAHSACSLLRAHSFHDTSSRGIRSYTLSPLPLARVFVHVSCARKCIKAIVILRIFVHQIYGFAKRLNLEIYYLHKCMLFFTLR